jgi:hypothetical protein
MLHLVEHAQTRRSDPVPIEVTDGERPYESQLYAYRGILLKARAVAQGNNSPFAAVAAQSPHAACEGSSVLALRGQLGA